MKKSLFRCLLLLIMLSSGLGIFLLSEPPVSPETGGILDHAQEDLEAERCKGCSGERNEEKGVAIDSRSDLTSLSSEVENQTAIKTYAGLAKKALRSDEEQKAWIALLENHSLISAAGRILAGSDTEDQDADIRLRMLMVSFLSDALSLHNNREKQRVLSTIETAIERQIPDGTTREIQKSHAGDKIELYQLLLGSDRQRADQLSERSADQDLRKILDFARMMAAH